MKKYSLIGIITLLVSLCFAGSSSPDNSHLLLPLHQFTPGATFHVTSQEVCIPGYSKKVRDVTEEERHQVFIEYGIAHPKSRQFEVDHLISLELGGSNKIQNLWPEPLNTHPWNAHVKDKLENKLHSLVCGQQLSLRHAQNDIASNWIKTYQIVFHTKLPLVYSRRIASHHRQNHHSQNSSASVQVWVNTKTGIYHYPGTRWYGNTEEGEYMSEKQALADGFRAAENGQ